HGFRARLAAHDGLRRGVGRRGTSLALYAAAARGRGVLAAAGRARHGAAGAARAGHVGRVRVSSAAAAGGAAARTGGRAGGAAAGAALARPRCRLGRIVSPSALTVAVRLDPRDPVVARVHFALRLAGYEPGLQTGDAVVLRDAVSHEDGAGAVAGRP